jgi:hypothetical protein
MVDLPATAEILPPAAPIAPGAPAIFTRATAPRAILWDAFYTDERNTALSKADHPARSFYNTFTRFVALPPSYANARTMAAGKAFQNPLSVDPPALSSIATVLPQKFAELRVSASSTRTHFNEVKPYFIFVPKKLKDLFDARPAGSKPQAKISLFFGVGPEVNLFGLRRFFAEADDAILITVPGVERAWPGYGRAWGIGITTAIIEDLMKSGGLAGIAFTVEVMAGYSTGYRGLNLTIINKLVSLSNLKRVIYYDAFYNHDDYPQPPAGHPFYKKLTHWAIKIALGASSVADVYAYAYTHPGGVPRVEHSTIPIGPRDSLIKDFGGKIHFFDLEFPFQGKPAIGSALEKICLARLVESAIGDYVKESEIGADILALIRLLPARGNLSISGRTGFTELRTWIATPPQSNALSSFPLQRAFDLVVKHKLLATEWTTNNIYEFRHRNFVQEIGKEGLLP